MPSPRTPSLRRHKPSGQAVVTLGGQDCYLGPWPATLRQPPPAAREACDRLIAEWLANGRRRPRAAADAPALTVNELILAFWRHAETHYRREDGTPTSELKEYRRSLTPLRELYGPTPAADFSPLKLKAVRQRMIDAGLRRGVVNQRVGRIVSVFKWGVSEEMAPESAWRSLTTVRGLERGRTVARETEPVRPVADTVVDATLPFARPPVAAMIRLQRLTGARPGEVCAMRACDLDMTGAVWLYRPPGIPIEAHRTLDGFLDAAEAAERRWLQIAEDILKRIHGDSQKPCYGRVPLEDLPRANEVVQQLNHLWHCLWVRHCFLTPLRIDTP